MTLKTLCGFSNSEIAHGLLLNAETVKKRIQRAKQSLVDLQLKIELPPPTELPDRLEIVHQVLYLMFNEGYSTSHGKNMIREDICEDAARLCQLLCESEYANTSTYALMALMLFHASRFDARVDSLGDTITLEHQDRSQWNLDFVRIGERWLERAGRDVTRYHIEAMIAWHHCRAASIDETDWNRIVAMYDRLIELTGSPIHQLNRAIALGESGEVDAAIDELDRLRNEKALQSYLLLDCAQARLHERQQQPDLATDCYLQALSRKPAEHEASFIKKQLTRLADRDPKNE